MAYKQEDYEIQLGLKKLTTKLKKQGYSEEDVLEGGKDCIILYP